MSDRVGNGQQVVSALETGGLSREEYCRRRRMDDRTLSQHGPAARENADGLR